MKKIDWTFHALAGLIAIVSIAIAFFGFSVINGDLDIASTASNTASLILLGVGAGFSTLQVGFVFGGIALAYINEIYK